MPRKGELCYLSPTLGAPFKDMAGASCVITALNAGAGGRYTEVRVIGETKKDTTWIFHPGEVHRENRPWMRRHVRAIVNAQKELERIAERMRRFANQIGT